MSNIPRYVPTWNQPIVIGRHAFGDQYKATDFIVPGPGKLKLVFEGRRKWKTLFLKKYLTLNKGCALGMYNLEESIIGFARACFNYGLNLGWPVYMSTKNTILKAYDGLLKILLSEFLKKNLKKNLKKKI